MKSSKFCLSNHQLMNILEAREPSCSTPRNLPRELKICIHTDSHASVGYYATIIVALFTTASKWTWSSCPSPVEEENKRNVWRLRDTAIKCTCCCKKNLKDVLNEKRQTQNAMEHFSFLKCPLEKIFHREQIIGSPGMGSAEGWTIEEIWEGK